MAHHVTTRALTRDDHAAAAPLLELLSDGTPLGDIAAFDAIITHPGTTIFGSFDAQRLTCVVTLHVLPNLTRGGRPYALIENVVTSPDHRNKGYARATMQAAIDAAWQADAYKIMLLTGQDTGALGFYESLGFNADQKFGMQLRRVPPRRA